MAISLSNDPKNSLSVTNEAKFSAETWDDATYVWNEATGTWEQSGTVLARDSKNSLSVTNEPKN